MGESSSSRISEKLTKEKAVRQISSANVFMTSLLNCFESTVETELKVTESALDVHVLCESGARLVIEVSA